MSVNKEFNYLVVAIKKGVSRDFYGGANSSAPRRFLALESLKLYLSILSLFLQIMSLTLYCRKSKI